MDNISYAGGSRNVLGARRPQGAWLKSDPHDLAPWIRTQGRWPSFLEAARVSVARDSGVRPRTPHTHSTSLEGHPRLRIGSVPVVRPLLSRDGAGDETDLGAVGFHGAGRHHSGQVRGVNRAAAIWTRGPARMLIEHRTADLADEEQFNHRVAPPPSTLSHVGPGDVHPIAMPGGTDRVSGRRNGNGRVLPVGRYRGPSTGRSFATWKPTLCGIARPRPPNNPPYPLVLGKKREIYEGS